MCEKSCKAIFRICSNISTDNIVVTLIVHIQRFLICVCVHVHVCVVVWRLTDPGRSCLRDWKKSFNISFGMNCEMITYVLDFVFTVCSPMTRLYLLRLWRLWNQSCLWSLMKCYAIGVHYLMVLKLPSRLYWSMLSKLALWNLIPYQSFFIFNFRYERCTFTCTDSAQLLTFPMDKWCKYSVWDLCVCVCARACVHVHMSVVKKRDLL